MEGFEAFLTLGLSLKDQNLACIRNAIKKGVKVAVGTDYVGWPAEQSAKEFRCLVEVGLSPMEAIKAGIFETERRP